MNPTIQVIICFCIAAGVLMFFYLYHLRPRSNDTSDRQETMNLPVYRLVDKYLKVSTIGITLAAIFWNHPLLLEFHDLRLMVAAGLIIAGAGLTLFILAMRHLSKQYTPCYNARLPKELVTTGPYSRIRHPIYTANIVMLAGLFIASGSFWLLFNLALMLSFYLPIVRREEQSILAEFPAYGEYIAQTGRFFPRLFGSKPASM